MRVLGDIGAVSSRGADLAHFLGLSPAARLFSLSAVSIVSQNTYSSSIAPSLHLLRRSQSRIIRRTPRSDFFDHSKLGKLFFSHVFALPLIGSCEIWSKVNLQEFCEGLFRGSLADCLNARRPKFKQQRPCVYRDAALCSSGLKYKRGRRGQERALEVFANSDAYYRILYLNLFIPLLLR